jgi:hypothetical protein
VTTGSVQDAKVMDNLIREGDRAVYGDKGYANDRKQRQAEAAGVLWAVKGESEARVPTGRYRNADATIGSGKSAPRSSTCSG